MSNTVPARILMVLYNVVWWVPVFLPIFNVVSYRTGFVGFLLITGFRALVNVYRNNVLPVEVGYRFPLRSP